MLFGAHVSTAKGYTDMARYAQETGCECVQVFAKSPRMWSAKPLTDKRLTEMAQLRADGAVGPVLTHTSYLLNLSGSKDDLREKSTIALADELVRASLLGAECANTHLGTSDEHAPDDAHAADSELSDESRRAAARAGAAIARAWNLAEEELARIEEQEGRAIERTCLLLEDTAGAGSVFGSSVAQLAACIDASGLGPERVGITIDTCHAWAAGYDVSGTQGWDDLVGTVDELVGLERFRWIHANDCLRGCGEHIDRHAWIGHGRIGVEGFAAMVADPRLAHINVACEAPGELPAKELFNVGILRFLREGLASEEAFAKAHALCPDAHAPNEE